MVRLFPKIFSKITVNVLLEGSINSPPQKNFSIFAGTPKAKNLRILIYIFLVTLFISKVNAQEQNHDNIYNYNYYWEAPATVAGFTLNYFGLDYLKDKPRLDSMTIINLDRNDIWKFDRRATYKKYENYESSQLISDIGMNITLFLPALLALDDEIRKDWLKVLLIYLETQALGANLYLWAGPVSTNRIRPFVYNDDYPWEMKVGSGAQDSFFSGHTSWTAGASFFMAKVYSDYHPELGNKKYWLYAAAIIPPVFVGYYRFRAGKHFPTDILTGLAIGTATGILIPHLHKVKKKKSYSVVPFFGDYSGMAFTMKL